MTRSKINHLREKARQADLQRQMHTVSLLYALRRAQRQHDNVRANAITVTLRTLGMTIIAPAGYAK